MEARLAAKEKPAHVHAMCTIPFLLETVEKQLGVAHNLNHGNFLDEGNATRWFMERQATTVGCVQFR